MGLRSWFLNMNGCRLIDGIGLMSMLSLTFITTAVSQDAWPLQKHGLQLSLGEWWTVSDQHYDHDGNRMNNIAEYGYYATSVEAAYGITARMAATLTYPFANYVYSKLPLSGQKNAAWQTGDAEVGLHYTILQRPSTSILADLIVSLPFGETGDIQPTGDTGSNQQLGIMLIRRIPFLDSIGWWQLNAAFNNRNGDYSDEFHYGIEIGLLLATDFTASVALTGIRPLGNTHGANEIQPESLFSNRKEVHMLSPDVYFKIDEHISLGVGIDVVLGGKNRLAGTGYEVAIHYRN